MSLVLLFHYLLLNMFRMLVHPSSGACDLLWIYFMCCIALVRCVSVLWCGSAGVVWYPYAGWSSASACIRILNVLAGVLGSREAGRVHTVHIKCWKPYAVIYGLALLKMGIMVPETCRTNGWLINHNCCIKLVSQITSY
jgi:hypothetical protein